MIKEDNLEGFIQVLSHGLSVNVVYKGKEPYVAATVVMGNLLPRKKISDLYKLGLLKMNRSSNEDFYKYAHPYTNGSTLIPLINLVEIEKESGDIMVRSLFFWKVLDDYYKFLITENENTRNFLESVGILKRQKNVDELKEDIWVEFKAKYEEDLLIMIKRKEYELEENIREIKKRSELIIQKTESVSINRLAVLIKKREREEANIFDIKKRKRILEEEFSLLERQKNELLQQNVELGILKWSNGPPRSQKGWKY